MLTRYAPWLVAILGIALLALVRPTAADDPPAEKPKTDAKAASVKVEKQPLTAAVTLKGTVQADAATELAVRLRAWSGPLIVAKAVEHGTPVKAGDVLVEFETEKLDHALRDARQERDLAELAIRQAELELPIIEKQNQLELVAAERTAKEATDDLQRFLSLDRPLSEQSAHFRLKTAEYFLDSARDQLKQLQKMYKDKDLTEETEQVILKRYKFAVEMEEFFLKQTQNDTEHTLRVSIPRREQTAKDAVAKSEIALSRAREVQPLAVKQKRLALAKLHFDEGRAKERLADLEKDRVALTVKAPAEGLAYHGRGFRGNWLVASSPQENALLHGGTINPGHVFLTIVPRDKLALRAEVEEKELPGLLPGVKGRATPTAFADQKHGVRIARVAAAPLNGKFEVRLELDDKAATTLVPGMTCSVRCVTAQKAQALTVPASAVFQDGDDEGHYVYRAGATPQKQSVRVGLKSGDRIEIVEGLAEHDEIRSSKP